jgi:uncharacterized protein
MNTAHRNADGTPRYTNRLAGQTSPYLRQHAHNPVDWYPWGREALEAARASGKPIHLSVGYSACRWCHVLESESFEDEETATLLNERFINIKVDREERPDIDRIYQIAQQMLTQRSGGWPLTMFLTHDDQKPFFGGTYFPKEARYGLPAFKDLLLRVADYYAQHAPELRAQNEALMSALASLDPPPAPAATAFTEAPLRECRAQLARMFDPQHGGFGGAPKFPRPQMITWLLRCWQASSTAPEPDLQALYMATLTLRRMADGGLNDQLGGGFCRYAVDEFWMIPHFEKMLYDNGELLGAYAQAALATVDAARDAGAGGRLLLEPGCGFRGPRGQVLRLGARGSGGGTQRGRVCRVRTALRARPPRQLRGQVAPVRGEPAGRDRRGHAAVARGRGEPAHRRAREAARAARHACAPGAR